MANLTTSLDTSFTPATGDFTVQAKGTPVQLLRKNNAGAPFASVSMLHNEAKTVSNPVAGAVYQFASVHPTNVATVSADQ